MPFLNMHSDGCTSNDLYLLPCTMENGVFVTNVKWKIQSKHLNKYNNYFYSPGLFLHDPIKNEPRKIQLRLIQIEKPVLEYWDDNEWKFYENLSHHSTKRNFEFIVQFSNNFYYGSKNLLDDLRQYLVAIHGETIAFGGEIHPIQECSKETLLAFIEQEYDEDFIIECGGQEFKIKKIILQTRSPVFETMLSTNYFKEARENRMVIVDFEAEIVEKMLEFFETDFVTETRNYEVELYEIARKYLSKSFMEFTRLPFVNSLTIRNYNKLLRIARKHDDKETEGLMNEWYSKNHHLMVDKNQCSVI